VHSSASLTVARSSRTDPRILGVYKSDYTFQWQYCFFLIISPKVTADLEAACIYSERFAEALYPLDNCRMNNVSVQCIVILWYKVVLRRMQSQSPKDSLTNTLVSRGAC
jgi:hypothetical protein